MTSRPPLPFMCLLLATSTRYIWLCRMKDQEVQELMETASQSDRGLEAAERQAAEVGMFEV